jgi:hypothetical protein
MIGYWFKSSILSILLIPVIGFAQSSGTPPSVIPEQNTNKYTLNIITSNSIVRSLYVEKRNIDEREFPMDISRFVKIHVDRPHFALQFTCDEINTGHYMVNVEVYRNDILIATQTYENNAFITRQETNRLRLVNIFLIDK